jgi:hypothetical protein
MNTKCLVARRVIDVDGVHGGEQVLRAGAFEQESGCHLPEAGYRVTGLLPVGQKHLDLGDDPDGFAVVLEGDRPW